MPKEDWTTIGMPKSVKKQIDEAKPEGQAPYIFIQNLMEQNGD